MNIVEDGPYQLISRAGGEGMEVLFSDEVNKVVLGVLSIDSQKHGQEPAPGKQTNVQAPRGGRVGEGELPWKL